MTICKNTASAFRKSVLKPHLPLIEEVTWSNMREVVKQIAYDFFIAIERLNPDRNYQLYKIRYPYGASIIDGSGIFNIPLCDGRLVQISSNEVSKLMQCQIGYNHDYLPMALVLNGKVQQFRETSDKGIETEGIYSRGDLLSLECVLDVGLSQYIGRFWRLAAGVRTPVMLPSIADHASFERLRRFFNMDINKPKSQKDHWQLFVDLANQKNFPEKWSVEILVFSARWVEGRDDEAGQLFKMALLERSWKKSVYTRNMVTINHILDGLITSIRNKNANSFVLAMVRRIINASLGQSVSYIPYENENSAGPFGTLINIFMDIYALKKNAPIIMIPEIYNGYSERPHYISIQMPGLQFARMKSPSLSSLINDTREIMYTLNQFIKKVSLGDVLVDAAFFSQLADLEYYFYHADKDKYGELLLSACAFDDDPVMKKWRLHPKNNELAYRNEFMRSCVKFKRKC